MRLLIPASPATASTWSARATSRIRRAALLLFSIAAVLASGAAAVRGQSALDGFDPNANDRVWIVVIQPDGKILLGGTFTTLSLNGGAAVTRKYIARLNADGTLDTAFNPNANSSVYAIALQADGKILVGGHFNSMGGQTRNHIARLDATTGLPDSFDPGSDSHEYHDVYAIVVQGDGKVLVGGVFENIGGTARNRIARLDPATGLADSFNPDADGNVFTIALQADGKILTGGVFQNIGRQPRSSVARLDATTGLADSFHPDPNNTVGTIAIQADGKIVVGGFFTSIGGRSRNCIARLDPATGLADSFNPNANEIVLSVVIQPDGQILAGGYFTTLGGQTRNRIARLDPKTGLADSFNPNANEHVYAIALQKDGKILAGGDFTTLAPNGGATKTRNRIARLEIDGRVDQTLNLGFVPGNFTVATVVQPDGKILVGGSFISVLGVPRNNIARLNTDGTLDMAFDPNASNQVSAIAVQADGQILVGGLFERISGQTRNGMARLDRTTGLPDSFDPNVTPVFPVGNGVFSIAVQADGKVLVGGVFANVSGQPRKNIARLDAMTGQADSFDPNANNGVRTIAVQAGGKILVGGDFTNIGGATRRHIARLDAMTGLADAFNPDANGFVAAIVLQGDGKILVGGYFNEFEGPPTIGGQTRNYIARLDGTTGLADSFNPNANSPIYSIAVQADGKVLAGGQFGSIGGQARNRIARLNSTTGLADSFDPNAGEYVVALAVQADGKILAGGGFDTIGGATCRSFARLRNDTVALQDLAVARTAITWTRGGSSVRFARATFEYSTDNVNYTPLGNGIPPSGSSNWILAGLSLPSDVIFYIRARGYHSSGNGSESITQSVRTAFLLPAAQALNLSTRLRVGTGDNVGIGGFIVAGPTAKHVLVRAIGPSLAQFGVPGVLADPALELHGPNGFITIFNDNWRDDPVQAALIEATGIPPSNDFESAIEARLFPGPYTAVMSGTNNTSGVALVEVYDLDRSVDLRLTNTSTRALVGIGDNRVIAGFMLGNKTGNGEVIVRGLGPSLPSGLNPLADPTLELRDSHGTLLVFNNDWQDDPAQAVEITAGGLAPGNNLEAAIAASLPPGLYTALLGERNNGTGVGLVEIYEQGVP